MESEVDFALGQEAWWMSRTRSSTWNYLSGLVLTAVSVSAGVVTTPLLLRWLGDERLGAHRALLDWLGYLKLLELGLGGSLLPLLARAVARAPSPYPLPVKEGGEGRVRGVSEVTAVLVAGIRAYRGVAVLMLMAGAALLPIILYSVPVSTTVASDLQTGCLVSLLGLLLVPFTPFRLLAESGQRGYAVNSLLILQTLLICALGLVLAYAGWGITGQALAMLVGALPFHLLLAWDGIGRYPETLASLAKNESSSSIRRELWKRNRSTLIVDTCGRVSLLTDNIIIAYLLGPAVVVPFFITQRLALLVQGQLQGIGNASWAALVELYLAGDHETLNRRLTELTSMVAALGIATLAPIVAYNHHFVTLWVGAGRFGGEWATVVAAVNGFLQALFSLWGWLFSGTGQVGRLVWMYIVAAVLNLAVSLLGTYWFGLVGPLLGTLVAFVSVTLWWMPWLLGRVFGTSLRSLFGAVLLPLTIGWPYAAGIWWLAHAHIPWGWLSLASEMIVAALGYLALWWWLGLRGSERKLWRMRVDFGLSWRSIA
jgi:O-antigen/teichoic acid export membrane protein